MKIARSPLVRSMAIVTIVCAIAAGNLATSFGVNCPKVSCWRRTTWYRFGSYFLVYQGNVSTLAHASGCSGLHGLCSSSSWVCGCIMCGGIKCPCNLCCTPSQCVVPCAVGTTPVMATSANQNRCKH
jgi:hypothetical protein